MRAKFQGNGTFIADHYWPGQTGQAKAKDPLGLDRNASEKIQGRCQAAAGWFLAFDVNPG